MRVAIPLNIQLNRPYKQRPTSKKIVRNVQQHSSSGEVLVVFLNLQETL